MLQWINRNIAALGDASRVFLFGTLGWRRKHLRADERRR
jgi:hypothetical protein